MEIRVYATLISSFSRFSFSNSLSSRYSFTKALITAIPEKFSWEKSESLENASCLTSHFAFIALNITVPNKNRITMGIMESPVSLLSMFHILKKASSPRNSASQNISIPSPKHSCMVSRSLVNRLIRFPTLFT